MKVKLFIVIILMLAGCLTLSAQKQKPDKQDTFFRSKYVNSIGIGAGFTTGYGLSYRYLPYRDGFQINFAPYFQDYGKDAVVSLGLTYLHKIVATRGSNLYLYFANSYHYRNNYLNTYTNDYEVKDKWNTGIGTCFEFHAQKRIVWNIMTGYAQYNSFERLFFTVETALYFRFN